MRKIIFGSYDTETWGLTLTGLKLSTPTPKTTFVDVPGADGLLDLSTVNTGGEIRYNNRDLVATFECSNGTRADRLVLFAEVVNALHGRSMSITLPDDPDHYITGRLSVEIEYCDPAHGALKVKGVCAPWRLAQTEKTVSVTASATEKTVTLTNEGRRLAAPMVTVAGTGADVQLSYGDRDWHLSAGSYHLPDLILLTGANALKYKGTGSLTFKWREADL